MSYIDVLPLATMKTYLRIDDTQNETDAEIVSMINSAFRYIEKTTNLMIYDRNKEYVITDRCVKVYDHPINSVVKGIDEDDVDVTLTFKTNYNKELKHLYINYYSIDGDAIKFVLNVGYATPSDVPDDVIGLAKEIVKAMYFEQETDKTFYEMLSPTSMAILNTNRRFII